LERKWLKRIGEIIVESVVHQARIDAAKARGLKAGNMIPLDPKFFRSFGYRISGKSTIEITSTWSWITDLVKGRDKYPMKGLHRKKGERKVVPVASKNGVAIFRMVPLTTERSWIHPGIARHTFIRRGIKRARPKVLAVYKEALRDG